MEQRPPPLPTRIDPGDEEGLRRWSEHFGVTAQQLIEAEKAVGGDPAAVQQHLLQQGASAGAG
jgi:Protein of unknown function (DUF3606)